MVYCAACHVKPFGDDGDQTSLETIVIFHVLEHGNHLLPRIFHYLSLPWARWRCLLIGGIPKFHHLLKPVCQSMTLFEPLLSIVTFQEMTIKHLMYMQKVPFLYTERACVVFFSFEIHPGRFCVLEKRVLCFELQ